METSFSFSDTFRYAFKKFGQNFFIFLGFSLLMGYIFYASLHIKQIQLKIIFSFLIFFYYLAGLTNLSIKIFQNEKCKFSDAFLTFKKFIKSLLGSIMYLLIIGLGSFFFVIPGIILAVRFQFFNYYVLYENTTLIEAFKKSYETTKGYKLQLKLLLFWFIVLNFQMFLFFLFFIIMPISWLAQSYIYYSLIGATTKTLITSNKNLIQHPCPRCGKSPPYLSTYGLICTDCEEQLINELLVSKSISQESQKFLQNFERNSAIKFYNDLYNKFTYDHELDLSEISLLNQLQKSLKLSNNDVQYTERILPYMYVYYIKAYNKLPDITAETKRQFPTIILRNDELVHFTHEAQVIELKKFSEYVGGSSGFSFRIAKGVTYRVGGHKGYFKKVERYVVTSRGNLLVTSQRLFLHPYPGNKPVSIPLDKILSYNGYSNGIEVYINKGDKEYFFEIKNSGAVEIFGICLSHLYNPV